MSEIYEEIRQSAEYAKKSRLMNLLYEAYGMAKASYRLGAISYDEFRELNRYIVREGINDPKYFEKE